MSDSQCASCGGFCKKAGCEKSNVTSLGIRPVFEQWALEQGFDIARSYDNTYKVQTTDAAWGGWVAANAPQNTSAALERVIAEQQKEIDIIRKYRAVDAERWAKHNKGIEDLIENCFGLLNNPSSHDALMSLKLSVAYQGWCLTCERSPCECGADYD